MQLGIQAMDVTAYYGDYAAVRNVSMAIPPRRVTAIIGPSGCGKSTFLRCLNRMHELVPGARVSGRILFGHLDIYAPGLEPAAIRRRIGMVFQRPTVFPTMSIFDNVAAGLTLAGGRSRKNLAAVVEQSLTRAGLWDDVKDRLRKPATGLSGGQQQRLCVARALAVEPEVLLMDEPTSALDPLATARMEELVQQLCAQYTVVIVTHNMQQAARISDCTAFFLQGELVEFGPTSRIFTTPADKRTEDYLTGQFG